MRIFCLQHASFEGPGHIGVWARERGHAMETIHLWRGEALPPVREIDLLVAMGGPMSVNDESTYPWLAAEKQLIRNCIGEGRFVLGVCLGLQLIAAALGARVYRNRVREIGWFPVRMTPAARKSAYLSNLPRSLEVLHWHGETCDLPPGCTHLAESDGCAIQAFGHPSALALQFHLEAAKDGIGDLIRHCAEDLCSGPFEQSAPDLLAGEQLHGETLRHALRGILSAVERSVEERIREERIREERMTAVRRGLTPSS